VFGRSKDSTSPAEQATPGLVEETPGLIEAGKGRPTPKRKTAEAANRRPLVPQDRKAAAKDARAAQRTERDRQYSAMQTGDERYMPAKDKGPVRRYIRQYVDARWSLGELFLPVAIVMLLLNMLLTSVSPELAFLGLVVLYLFIIGMVVDVVIMWRKLRKKLAAKFGDAAQQRGLMMYAVTRVFQIRRARLPKPQVKHGDYPE
jgi:Flp pilus assembly protein TadB